MPCRLPSADRSASLCRSVRTAAGPPGLRRTGGRFRRPRPRLRTGLLARRAKVLERAWVRVAREAVGPDGQVVPQEWLAHTTALQVDPIDRRRLDLVIYGATPLGGALCCNATLVSPFIRSGQPGAAGAMAPHCRLRSDANGRRTRDSARVARSISWSWALRSGRWNEGALRLLRGSVGLGKAVVVTVGRGRATGRRQHGARQRSARAHMRAPAAGPGARPDPEPAGPSRLPLR